MTTRILVGDCRAVLKTLADKSVHCCCTSSPYFGLRDYQVDGQLGLEASPGEYVAKRSHEYLFLLSKRGTYFYDSEAIKEPVAEATLRARPNHGRPVDRGFPGGLQNGNGRLGSEPMRNKRSVWHIATQPFSRAGLTPEGIDHYAPFPPALVEPCILAGSSPRACERCAAPWRRAVERTPAVVVRSARAERMGEYGWWRRIAATTYHNVRPDIGRMA